MSDYSEIFEREPEPWRMSLGALRLTMTGPAESVDVKRAQSEVEELVKVLNDLAAHDAEVAARAWDEGYQEANQDLWRDGGREGNPYRKEVQSDA